MKELRVYVIDIEEIDDDFLDNMGIDQSVQLNDEDFITVAEEQGNVYTLNGFAQAFNHQDINSSTDIIRFIEVEV